MDVDDAVAELYGAALPDFVATRTRLVGRAKGEDPALAKDIGGLRKPSAAAWLLNQVARRSPEALEVVQHVGHRMRAATAAGDTAALRDLRGDRDGAIAGVLDAAAEVAADEDRPWSGAVQDEVRSTVVAALASEESTAALASGALLRALHYAGFGEVTLDDAVAARLDRLRRPAAPPPPGEDADAPTAGGDAATGDSDGDAGEVPDSPEEADAARRGQDAITPSPEDAAVDEAERALAAARLHAEEAHAEHAATRRRAKDLRALLATAREEEAAAHARAEEADDAVADARAELARLTRRR